MITHESLRLVSLIALLYSISSDKYDFIFLSSIRKNVFNNKTFHLCIYYFHRATGLDFFQNDNSLVHMQISCIVATSSDTKVCPTSAFQLILVKEIKK